MIYVVLWVAIGVLLWLMFYFDSQERAAKAEKMPIVFTFLCLIGGPIIVVIGVVKGTAEWFKKRRNGHEHKDGSVG